MKQRILVAIIGVPALIGVLCFAPDWATAVLVAALCVSGRHELMAADEPGARGTIQTRATIHLYRQATAIRNIALCKRPFRGGYIRNLRRSPRRMRAFLLFFVNTLYPVSVWI